MKLASLKNNTRDGQLVVVNRDLSQFVECTHLCKTMQELLDFWDEKSLALLELYKQLNGGMIEGKPFLAENCLAPLPRAYEWVDGSAYINHIKLVRKARGGQPPEDLLTNPLVYQGGSGVLLGPREPIELWNPDWGCDFESEICVVLADTPQGTTAANAEACIRLLTIANDVSLRSLIPEELKKGFGFFNAKPATAFAPCMVTPDELGASWQGCRVNLPLLTTYNQELFGEPEAGPEMHFSFADLVAHITKTRSFTAGTILGSGTISNEDLQRGFSCLAEKRMIEKIQDGECRTPFMNYGDRIQIDLCDGQGKSICGSILQKVVPKKG